MDAALILQAGLTLYVYQRCTDMTEISQERCTLSLNLCRYVRFARPVVAIWQVATCLSPVCLAAKPVPDLRCLPSQNISPPNANEGVTLWK